VLTSSSSSVVATFAAFAAAVASQRSKAGTRGKQPLDRHGQEEVAERVERSEHSSRTLGGEPPPRRATTPP